MRRYSRSGSPGSIGVGSSWIQASTSVKPAASSRARLVDRWRRSRGPPTARRSAAIASPDRRRCSPPRRTARPAGRPGRRTAARWRNMRGVVGDPVERRRRQDGVDRRGLAAGAARRGPRPRTSPARRTAASRARAASIIAGEPSSATTRPSRQPLQEPLRDPPGAAARVQHRLVAAQRQPVQDGRAPAGHRVRDPVVGRRRPSRGGRCAPAAVIPPRPSRPPRPGASPRVAAASSASPRAGRSPMPVRDRAAHQQGRAHDRRQVERVDRGLPGRRDELRGRVRRPAGSAAGPGPASAGSDGSKPGTAAATAA